MNDDLVQRITKVIRREFASTDPARNLRFSGEYPTYYDEISRAIIAEIEAAGYTIEPSPKG